ncbi:MAG TPA: MauE/DoxX family redox-associated membrane protein, partial [Pirellulales bacterium]|nr:MauE/DoxX family redox-associated membrane protein [Pirellulales bacterium]
MNAAIEESRAAPLRRFLAGFALALMATSWPLWTPQHVFPQVPAFAGLGRLPDAWQWLCLAGVLAALIAALVAPRDSVLGPRSLLLFGLLMPVLMASDQHRWQPWAYQLVLTSLPLATLSAAESWPLLRLLTVSIYLYSGWSKCDVTFLDDLGQQFVARLMAVVHDPSLDQWSLEVRRAVAGALAIGELLIGGALLWGRTRRVGLWAAVASHLAL